MMVRLGKFAVAGLRAAHPCRDIQAAVRLVLGHYARRLEAGGARLAPPRFLADLEPPAPEHSFDLTLDGRTETALEAEAARHGTSVDLLVSYAVMVHLAEQEIGRSGRR
jgi:hypothetical protein